MRKKTYRKVWPLINTLPHAAYQASKLTIAEWNQQLLPIQAAFNALSTGDWSRENWQPLFECLNRIESISKLLHVDDDGLIYDAQKAYSAALSRRELQGVSAFKADELKTLREVIETYGNLLKEITHKQFQDVCSHTNANMTRILKQKKAPMIGGMYMEAAT